MKDIVLTSACVKSLVTALGVAAAKAMILRLRLAVTIAGGLAGFLVACPAFAQSGVGVSIGINQPGVYGRIDIGNAPQPLLVYPQPVIIQPSPIAVQRQPIYLYVPLAHQRDWSRYCRNYGACGQPVYFVQEQWVRERYHHGWGNEQHHRRQRDEGDGQGQGRGRGHGHHGAEEDRRPGGRGGHRD
jgi:hypothetical protein